VSPDGAPLHTPNAAAAGLSPAALESAYGIRRAAANMGSGQTVAIVDAYDDPKAEADMNQYRQHFGLPLCTSTSGCFKKINEYGATSPLPAKAQPAWGGEISLDLDMVSAICPLCHVVLVEALKDTSVTPDTPDSTDMYIAEHAAFSLDPDAVSNSWAAFEYRRETARDQLLVPTYPNTAVVAAAGDAGYGAEYPSADPNVISVGGTVLTKSTNKRGWTERAWSGTGSGCSAYEPAPSWQTPPFAGCGRETNDISAVGEGVAVYDSFRDPGGPWIGLSGTSVGTPIIAAMIALAGGHIHSPSQLYAARSANPGAFHDIVTGSNGTCGTSSSPTYSLCHAVAGYDGPTGVGTPHGIAGFRAGAS
jgi:subtilase family serine protease